jgi:dephospho-CoA kinase
LAAFARLGAATLSTDTVVHELYDSADDVRAAVLERWGPDVAPGGRVDRARVATAAFAAPEELAWLEALLWPRVGTNVEAWREQLARRQQPPRAAVVETPLLFEAGLDDRFDATIAIVAAEPLRVARATARGHVAADDRVSRQLSQEEKAARATYVVSNDGTVEELERALAAVLEQLELPPAR